jgi:hypothetical protein
MAPDTIKPGLVSHDILNVAAAQIAGVGPRAINRGGGLEFAILEKDRRLPVLNLRTSNDHQPHKQSSRAFCSNHEASVLLHGFGFVALRRVNVLK